HLGPEGRRLRVVNDGAAARRDGPLQGVPDARDVLEALLARPAANLPGAVPVHDAHPAGTAAAGVAAVPVGVVAIVAPTAAVVPLQQHLVLVFADERGPGVERQAGRARTGYEAASAEPDA